MRASDACIAAIRNWEGCAKWDGVVYRIYPDLNGFSTIGVGHKLTHQEIVSGVYANGITQDQADSIFLSDITPVENQVAGMIVNGWAWKQGQTDALTSFCYNLGHNNTMVMLSHGIDQVPQQIVRWTHAAGVVQPGLVARRNQELQWWNS